MIKITGNSIDQARDVLYKEAKLADDKGKRARILDEVLMGMLYSMEARILLTVRKALEELKKG